ncbi:MAG: protein phosphatase 2C domain-containing protein [Bacteroidia bacterium]
MAHPLFTWAAETHVGLHRSHNEDRYDTFACPLGTAFIVCDGMGGHAAGDVAAALAIQRIKELLLNATFEQPVSYWLRRAFFHAHQGIHAYTQQQYGSEGMGTTAVILLITPQGEAWWAHTGDSRLYLLRQGALYRLTHDHSYVSFLVDSGFISPEAAFGHPQSNQLLFTIGSSGSYTMVEASSYPFRVKKGDIFLLCSDGISGLIPDDQIAEKLKSRVPLVERTKSLIHAALQAGGYDNATAITVEIISEPYAASNKPLWGTIAVGVLTLVVGFLLGQVVSLSSKDVSLGSKDYKLPSSGSTHLPISPKKDSSLSTRGLRDSASPSVPNAQKIPGRRPS